jgi:hypothetical protein
MEEIELANRIKMIKPYIGKFKYLKCFETDKMLEKEVCELSILNICDA